MSGAPLTAECPECGRGVPASLALEGERLHETVVQLLAPTYGHDPATASSDDVVHAFISDDAQRVIVLMRERGLQLVRGTS